MAKPHGSGLPPVVTAMLDGSDLEAHVGKTLLLCAAKGDSWPRVALLSVGEVLATASDELRLVLYGGSRTTSSANASGKALLVFVCDGTTYKLDLLMHPLALPDNAGHNFKGFIGSVVEWRRDEVAYARVRHGIEYELADPPATIRRWEEQISWLRSGTPL